jgi:hypothetical protein
MDGLERVSGIALGRQHTRQTVQPIAVPGPELQKLPVNGAGLAETPLVPEHGAKIAQRLAETRRQRKRPAGAGFCLLKLALPPQCGAEIVVRLCIVRLQAKRLAITSHRFSQFVPPIKQGAKIVVRAGQVGLKGECMAIAGLGRFRFPLFVKRVAEIAVRRGQVWLQDEHLAVAGNGIIEAARLMMPDRLCEYASHLRRWTVLHAAARFLKDLRKPAKTALGVIRRGSYRPRHSFQSAPEV